MSYSARMTLSGMSNVLISAKDDLVSQYMLYNFRDFFLPQEILMSFFAAIKAAPTL